MTPELEEKIGSLAKRITKLEMDVAHLKGEMTDQDVEQCIQNGLDKQIDMSQER